MALCWLATLTANVGFHRPPSPIGDTVWSLRYGCSAPHRAPAGQGECGHQAPGSTALTYHLVRPVQLRSDTTYPTRPSRPGCCDRSRNKTTRDTASPLSLVEQPRSSRPELPGCTVSRPSKLVAGKSVESAVANRVPTVADRPPKQCHLTNAPVFSSPKENVVA